MILMQIITQSSFHMAELKNSKFTRSKKCILQMFDEHEVEQRINFVFTSNSSFCVSLETPNVLNKILFVEIEKCKFLKGLA